MTIRTIIENRGWRYRLHIRQVQPGQYFAKLAALNGAKLAHAPCAGVWPSIDAAVEPKTAEATYRQLVGMLDSNATAAAHNGAAPETTVAHSAELSANG